MSKKDLVYNFLESVSNQVTMQEAWEKFETENPGVLDKASFSSYRSTAKRDGVFVPVENKTPKVSISSSVSIKENEMEAEYKTIDLDNIDMSKFEVLKTNTKFDEIASKRNGLMAATTYIITGESGAGKTTIATNIADYIIEANPEKTAGFISCEMDEFDWTEECFDNPRLAKLPTIFMLDYLDATNYVEILQDALSKFDYVILDSFEVVIDQLKEIMGWTAKKAESELINILRLAASNHGTTIMAIQQYTKGGTFVGSNKIKHMLTGMIFVKFDENKKRYVEFTKNRRGGSMINKPLYFDKCKDTGRIIFDSDRFDRMMKMQDFSEDELDNIKNEENIFDTEIIEKAKKKQQQRLNALDLAD